MPKFVIERQYLVPTYQRLIIDAPDITTACQEAVEDNDWESAEEDGDGSGATTINAGREIPQGLLEQIERGNIHSGSFLWEDQPEYVWTTYHFFTAIPIRSLPIRLIVFKENPPTPQPRMRCTSCPKT